MKVWYCEGRLAKPLLDILCKQHPDETIMSLVCDEKKFETAVANAKVRYAEYLWEHGLISVVLELCRNPAAQGEQPQRHLEFFDDTVCVQRYIRYRECLI